MPRQMSPEREREYAELHGFIDFVATHITGIDPSDPVHPTNVGKRIVAEYGKSKALEGLKQAVNDTVEDLGEQTPEFCEKLDSELRERGLVSLSEVRRRYAASYRRILKRGHIKSETEYYLLRGMIADFSSLAGPEERTSMEAMLLRYEGEA
jgi:hypothetical protein